MIRAFSTHLWNFMKPPKIVLLWQKKQEERVVLFLLFRLNIHIFEYLKIFKSEKVIQWWIWPGYPSFKRRAFGDSSPKWRGQCSWLHYSSLGDNDIISIGRQHCRLQEKISLNINVTSSKFVSFIDTHMWWTQFSFPVDNPCSGWSTVLMSQKS